MTTQTPATFKVRISATVASHLSGSHAWQCPQDDDGYHGNAVSLMSKIKAKTQRKDGSRVVDLTSGEAIALYDYADVMALGARDSIQAPGLGDTEALSDFNAANACKRQLDKIGQRS